MSGQDDFNFLKCLSDTQKHRRAEFWKIWIKNVPFHSCTNYPPRLTTGNKNWVPEVRPKVTNAIMEWLRRLAGWPIIIDRHLSSSIIFDHHRSSSIIIFFWSSFFLIHNFFERLFDGLFFSQRSRTITTFFEQFC